MGNVWGFHGVYNNTWIGRKVRLPVKISYDSDTDTLNIIFADNGIFTRELGEGFVAEYDVDDQLTRVMIPNAMKTSLGKDVFSQLVVEGIGPFAKNDPLIIIPRLFDSAETFE
jgi:hypothetical protein